MEWIFGILSAGLVAAVAAGVNIPVLGNGRAAYFTLLVLGFAMCARAMKLETYGWTNPFNIAGIVLGSLALLLTVAVLFRIPLPQITTDKAAIIALAAIMAIKVVVALVRGAAV